MLNFFNMMNDYKSRKVDRYEQGELFISTASVSDSTYGYETAVRHPQYNDGKLVIVENYASLKDAKLGHQKWVKKMTAAELPDSLKDVGESKLALLLYSSPDAPTRIFPKKDF